jgi:large conductance mechanosensitive channel
MCKEFKQFIVRGNVLGLAVAVVLGVAFGAAVMSFVKDILMPPIGLLLGHIDFSNLFINLSGQQYASLAEAQKAGAATINYGAFINTLINFVLVAFAVFLVVRMVNKDLLTPAPTKTCPYCQSAISSAATRCPQCTSEIGNRE